MSKKLGPLERGIVVGLARGLIKQAMAPTRRAIELEEKFALLFEKYGVAEGDWRHLTVCLALTHEPGFKPIATAGPKAGAGWRWTRELDTKLIDGVALLLKENVKLSTRKACEALSKTPDFKRSSADSLRRRLRTLNGPLLGG